MASASFGASPRLRYSPTHGSVVGSGAVVPAISAARSVGMGNMNRIDVFGVVPKPDHSFWEPSSERDRP
jgi:hypothetical protein